MTSELILVPAHLWVVLGLQPGSYSWQGRCPTVIPKLFTEEETRALFLSWHILSQSVNSEPHTGKPCAPSPEPPTWLHGRLSLVPWGCFLGALLTVEILRGQLWIGFPKMQSFLTQLQPPPPIAAEETEIIEERN